jgi:hypothetical protein
MENENKEQILRRRKEIERELEDLLKETRSDFTLAHVLDAIYNEEESDDMMKIVAMFDRGGDASELENILDLVADAWNYLPHKILGGLSPAEKSLERGVDKIKFTPKKFNNVYQFKITLKDIAPPVWRRILVPENYTFFDLHCAIQDAMGWTDSHLHEFRTISPRREEVKYIRLPDEDAEEPFFREHEEKISDWFSLEKNTKINYDYDFGDSWEHLIELEKILPAEAKVKYPVCLDGKRACPPEDCGGIPGYEDLIEIMKNHKHPEYKEMKEWLGGILDPEAFNIQEIEFENPQKRFKEIAQYLQISPEKENFAGEEDDFWENDFKVSVGAGAKNGKLRFYFVLKKAKDNFSTKEKTDIEKTIKMIGPALGYEIEEIEFNGEYFLVSALGRADLAPGDLTDACAMALQTRDIKISKDCLIINTGRPSWEEIKKNMSKK